MPAVAGVPAGSASVLPVVVEPAVPAPVFAVSAVLESAFAETAVSAVPSAFAAEAPAVFAAAAFPAESFGLAEAPVPVKAAELFSIADLAEAAERSAFVVHSV